MSVPQSTQGKLNECAQCHVTGCLHVPCQTSLFRHQCVGACMGSNRAMPSVLHQWLRLPNENLMLIASSRFHVAQNCLSILNYGRNHLRCKGSNSECLLGEPDRNLRLTGENIGIGYDRNCTCNTVLGDEIRYAGIALGKLNCWGGRPKGR